MALLALSPGLARAQARVSAVYATDSDPSANVDSCAVWVDADSSRALLFVTEKEGDRIQVLDASTGAPFAPRPFLGGAVDGSGPGEFDRPNGVWVIEHLPCAGEFLDVLLVTDQRNLRVGAFSLPELEWIGEFGSGEIGKAYGLAWYHDGRDVFVYVTDNIPLAEQPGKLKKYRLRCEEGRIAADLVLAFGGSGDPSLPNVESIFADFAHDRLHVCGDEGGDQIHVFHLDGRHEGVTYGRPQFEADQEGINLYDAGHGRGFLVISDQLRGGEPNKFEVFDRVSLESLGHFRSASGDPFVTTNTDGAYLEQRPFPGFADGGYFAVNDDHNVHAYRWIDVAEAMELEVSPLERPFPADPAEDAIGVSRESLWYHDGAWWTLLSCEGELSIARRDDGRFVSKARIGTATFALPRQRGDLLAVLSVRREEPRHAEVRWWRYESARRRWVPVSSTLAIGALAPIARAIDWWIEDDRAGGALPSARAVAVIDGELRVATSAGAGGEWDATAISLGAALEVRPRGARVTGGNAAPGRAITWVADDGIQCRVHRDGDPPDAWSEAEIVEPMAAASIALAALGDGRLLLVRASADGAGRVHVRGAAGSWSPRELAGELRAPALVVDTVTERVHLFHLAADGETRPLWHREALLASLEYGPAHPLVAWPSVRHGAPCVPVSLPVEARELVALAIGDDSLGRTARVELTRDEDREAPVTSLHDPAPGTAGVAPGSRLSFRLTDDLAGVDRSSVRVLVGGVALPVELLGTPRVLRAIAEIPAELNEPTIRIRIEARDLAEPPHTMVPFELELFTGKTPATAFLRGDANGDGISDVSDAVRILLGLFTQAIAESCLDAEDVNDDGFVDISDPLSLLGWLFARQGAPSSPVGECGLDPSDDTLDCEAHAACG